MCFESPAPFRWVFEFFLRETRGKYEKAQHVARKKKKEKYEKRLERSVAWMTFEKRGEVALQWHRTVRTLFRSLHQSQRGGRGPERGEPGAESGEPVLFNFFSNFWLI